MVAWLRWRLSTPVDSTYIHTVVREEMQTMRQDVIANVTSQVTSNIATHVAQRVSDIAAEKNEW